MFDIWQTVGQIIHLDSANVGEISPFVVFFVFFFATFISEDAACLTAGALAAKGEISFALALSACFAGIVVGDILLYWVGRIFGNSVVRNRAFSRFVSEKKISDASVWLEKRGVAAVFLSRFVTGLRLPTYLAAGFLRTGFPKFAFYFLLASAIWTPLLIGSVAFSQKFFFSQNLILSVILSLIVLKFFLHLSSWKNRRLLTGRLKRLVKWEFWSLRVFYFPVVCYVLWLAARHRSLTVFTCANPAILAGGFVGESKDEIYEALRKSPAASGFLLPHLFLSGKKSLSERVFRIWRFIDENKLNFPLVLKPNVGERGAGVEMVHSFRELRSKLEHIDEDYILQEFAGGVEASIFYYRYPNQKKGNIFSVTEKQFPSVIGDGTSTLENLILSDNRAVCLAQSYFKQNRDNLEFVPAAGEEFRIINIGTHSRGAVFLDGGWMRTEVLESKIDEICRGFEGFCFGRFDVKAGSFADLQKARNFKIIELNGVTSESTNIYDPKYNIFDAYRILFAQWRIAFEIGAENLKLGAKPASLSDLIKLISGKSVDFIAPNSIKSEKLDTNR